MRAQEAYELSKINSAMQLENILKEIRQASEAGKFEYLEYKSVCTSDTVDALRELGYFVRVGSIVVTILWDFQSIFKSRAEKDTNNHDCSIDN